MDSKKSFIKLPRFHLYLGLILPHNLTLFY